MERVKATRFTSDPPKTPYAPTWDYTIAEKMVDIDLEELTRVILLKEKEIRKEVDPPNWNSDFWGTDDDPGPGKDSLTAKAYSYNMLDWDYPIIDDLKKEIITFYDQYCKGTNNTDPPPIKIKCWANVLRTNQKIKKHYHATHPYTYLGGHLTVKCDNTSTVYVNPIDFHNEFVLKNVVGNMTLFPNYIAHYTSLQTSDEPRITIAWDIMPDLPEVNLECYPH